MKFQFFVKYPVIDEYGKIIYKDEKTDIFEGTSQEAYEEMCIRLSPRLFHYYLVADE